MKQRSLNEWKTIAKQIDQAHKSQLALLQSLQKKKVPKSYYSSQYFSLEKAIANVRSRFEEIMFDQLKDKHRKEILLNIFYGNNKNK
ncbi:MAG: hypothetical protein A2744_00190 [Candidatus Buchananbacteria bacterium RIFCSPHIGHO2_01_FULL_44_11]|uniref:Uncharacterized protein n=1 Tax=Candidatus Buchananbacteria bacterium RIFCSPHIGHO2_01_FULL_44_11 TaxID=1797535 RepID=A0A1G1Y0D0_9BACT|nr:MAG: hypothetical protein A2744_00190 [Candidatus Buchananbacteria bacterium RIFCSPHIGHO2_01_FULL_44_11]